MFRKDSRKPPFSQALVPIACESIVCYSVFNLILHRESTNQTPGTEASFVFELL